MRFVAPVSVKSLDDAGGVGPDGGPIAQRRAAFHCVTQADVGRVRKYELRAEGPLNTTEHDRTGVTTVTVTVADLFVPAVIRATAKRACVPAAMFVTARWNGALLTLPTSAASEKKSTRTTVPSLSAAFA